ncbi:MAG: nitroreductase [Magnetococcales bacterium]|nr:nitroreductase [Magnetococcales bacterium]
MNLVSVIEDRKSIRGFLDRAVSRETMESILQTARWSPSGANLQPWRVEVVMGATFARLKSRLTELAGAGVPVNPDYRFHPEIWKEPFSGRRRACGFGLLNAMGVGRDDAPGRRQAWLANYAFFDAPAAMMLFMDRDLGKGAWMDMGMFLQSILLTAHAHGLGVCPQAATADYPDVVRELLGVDRQFMLLAGLAIGYPDPNAPANAWRTPRLAVAEFATFHE